MSIAGDARFLSWNVYLEPFQSAHRVRYTLFFDIRNHKLLLVNSNTKQSSSYDFTCVSQCKISDKDVTLLTLYLDNTKQSYAVDFYFDSNYDRNCGNELLCSIIKKTILKTSTKYGINSGIFQIGVQFQRIINKKPKKVGEWKPRILSLIQNRILFFRDKAIDYHSLCIISLNARSFRCYKTLDYDHTIQIHLSNNLIYQLHLGDKTALNSLIIKMKTALTLYNKRALTRFHPTKLPLNMVKRKIEGGISPTTECTEQNKDQSEEAVFKAHEYMQSDTDDNETSSVHSEESIMKAKIAICAPETTTTMTHPFRFAAMVNNSMRLQSIKQCSSSSKYSHCPQYSNQTECKLQHPSSPISDALEPYKIVNALKQSTSSCSGNEIMTMVRDESRAININISSINRTISKIETSQSMDLNSVRRRAKKKKKKSCIHSSCSCDVFIECKQCEHCGHDVEDHGNDDNIVRRRRKKVKSKAKRKSAVVIKAKQKRETVSKIRIKSRSKRAASYAAKANKPLPKLPQKKDEYDEREEEKREITSRPMAIRGGLPKLTDLDSIHKLGMKRAESMLQIHRKKKECDLRLQKANTMKYRPQSAKIDALQMSIPCFIRSKSAGNASSPRYSDISNLCTLIWSKSSFIYSDNLCSKQIYNISVAKEGCHCLGIGINDWCFVWGIKIDNIFSPFLIRSLRKERVKQTCCSALHSLCITYCDVIYGWGSARLTNLSCDTSVPTRLSFLLGKGCRYLVACNTHSLAYDTRSIHIYSWGIHGPWLGYDNDNNKCNTFGLIKFDNYIYSAKYAILSADCCSQYTLILLNTGYVGCCGINEHGRMAIGKHVTSSNRVLWSTSALLRNIVRISAGSFHSGYIDMGGQVYTCGVGIHYRLGHGNQDTLYKPKLIESLKRIKGREIECVDSTTYIITTDGHLILFGTEPITNKTHKTPHIFNHLYNKYRVYNVSASNQFCVITATKIKEPLELPDIDTNIYDEAPIAYSSNNLHNIGFNYKRNYNHWNRNYNQNNHNKTHHYRPRSTNNNDNNNNNNNNNNETKYGRCNHAQCGCDKFVKSKSKWSKGKCKSCNHPLQHHKKIIKYPKYYYGQKKQKQKYQRI